MSQPSHPMLSAKNLQPNPRRVPAADSVTLRRSASPSSDSDNVEHYISTHPPPNPVVQPGKEDAPAPSSFHDVKHQTEKQHACDSQEWLDESNRNLIGTSNVNFIDHDPPFYLPSGKSSQETDTNNANSKDQSSGDGQAYRAGGLQLIQSEESGSDDYRSIIDDLTLENQDLKQRLKKFEQLYATNVADNKLFEVYIHHLSARKKRQLEGLLREFAAGVGPMEAREKSSKIGPNLQLAPLKVSSSQGTLKLVDSAYASMSASGNESSSLPRTEYGTPLAQQAQNTHQRVRNYVQDLPATLSPRGLLGISEEQKRILVVQKLEQLFLGRLDTSTLQGQSQQQQEVSQSAARADRRANDAKGQRNFKEGSREAKISKRHNLLNGELPSMLSKHSTSRSGSSTGGESSASSVNQRPTRPLDLDPAKGQDAQDNIKYMKHLGFDSPPIDATGSPIQRKGWIYLNLLSNMAQLHILNVTPDIVRDSIASMSSNFEISEDGHSVRWKGGSEPSKLGNDDNNGANEHGFLSSSLQHQKSTEMLSRGNRPAIFRGNSGELGKIGETARPNGLASGARLDQRMLDDRYYYSPMFYNAQDSESYGRSGSMTRNEFGDRSRTMSNETNFRSGGRDSRLRRNTEKESGKMTFYAANFYTDLSGDIFAMPSTIQYDRYSDHTMGDKVSMGGALEPRGAGISHDPETVARGPADFAEVVDIDGTDDMCAPDDEVEEKDLIELPVSGIGGVSPEDNFLVDVKVRHGQGKPAITATRHSELRASTMPSPGYAHHFTSSSSDDEDSSSEDEDMDKFASADILRSGVDESMYVPPTFLNVYSSESNRRTGRMEDAESSSIDLLEFARKANPEAIAAREQEFNDNISIQKADPNTAPSGSIAATVGDMSMVLPSQEDNTSFDGRMKRQGGRATATAGIKRSADEVQAVSSPRKRQQA